MTKKMPGMEIGSRKGAERREGSTVAMKRTAKSRAKVQSVV